MSENYNFSDFVKFRKGNTFGIGKIENFSREDDWFEYFEYILSEDLPAGCFIYILIKNIDPIQFFFSLLILLGRQPHHGFQEVFKTDQLKKGKMTDIIEKVQLSKLPEYIAMPERKGYIMRQQFIARELMPQLKTCFCGQFVNPDSPLVLCPQCEKPYHAECVLKKLDFEITNCDSCREQFQNNLVSERMREILAQKSTFQQTYKQPEKAIQIEEEEEEQIDKKESRIDLDKIIKKVRTKDGPKQVKTTVIEQEHHHHNGQRKEQVPQVTEPQKSSSQPYKNIQSNAVEKMKSWVERYRQMESNVSSFDKKRQEVREKFFSVIFYGIEELREMFQKDENSITQVEREIILQQDSSLFQFIKNLALDIEVYTHIKFNTQHRGKLEPLYVDRCKLIYLHMRDDKNLELRRKVISKEFQAQDLCTRDEQDFYNPERRKQTQEIALRVIELNKKDKDDEQKVVKDIEEISFSRNVIIVCIQQSINEEVQTPGAKKEGSSSRSQLREKMMEYSVEKSLQRFKKRILDELNEKERLQILANLEQYQLHP